MTSFHVSNMLSKYLISIYFYGIKVSHLFNNTLRCDVSYFQIENVYSGRKSFRNAEVIELTYVTGWYIYISPSIYFQDIFALSLILTSRLIESNFDHWINWIKLLFYWLKKVSSSLLVKEVSGRKLNWYSIQSLLKAKTLHLT